MKNNIEIASRVKSCAKSRGVSQAYLCEAIGKRRTFISEVAAGKDSFDQSEIEIMAEKLNVSPAYLLGETDNHEQEKKKPASDAELKVALFGGDGEVTDEMWDEVVRFAEFVKSKHSKGDK